MNDQPIDPRSLRDQVNSVEWYHTIELPGGIVTPGYFDNRSSLSWVPLPDRLDGKRCLDVGTCDGFWAFELERRGAAEVVGIDLLDHAKRDWPAGAKGRSAPQAGGTRGQTAFEIAHTALGSNVERIDCSIYEVTPERLGTFDFVFLGSLLLHLRDPILALSAVRTVVGGEFLLADAISLMMQTLSPRHPAGVLDGTAIPTWWRPNMAGLRRYCTAAGFEVLDSGGPHFFKLGKGYQRNQFRVRDLRPSNVSFWAVSVPLGSPSAWIKARPAV